MGISKKLIVGIKLLGILDLLLFGSTVFCISNETCRSFWLLFYSILGLSQILQTLTFDRHFLKKWRKFYRIYLVAAIIMVCVPIYGWVLLLLSSAIVAIIYAVLKINVKEGDFDILNSVSNEK